MKFLIDENLPSALAPWLRARGHDAIHVLAANLGGAADEEIAAAAQRDFRVIITRDADYEALVSRGIAVKVLRIAVGNASTDELLAWFEPLLISALARLDGGYSIIVLR